MNVKILRRNTAVDHRAVEGSMDILRDDLTVEQYAATLARMAGIVEAWEASAAAEATRLREPWLVDALAERRRLPDLLQDLAALHVSRDRALPEMPEWETIPELLGALYVMEGSRLGGQWIAKHVNQLLGSNVSTQYFSSCARNPGPMWRETLSILEKQVPDVDSGACILSAKRMFRLFGVWMKVEGASSAIDKDSPASLRNDDKHAY